MKISIYLLAALMGQQPLSVCTPFWVTHTVRGPHSRPHVLI